MFNKILKQVGLAKRLPPIPEARVDRCFGDRQARLLKHQLQKEEWRPARDTIARTRDVGVRSFLIKVCAYSVGDSKPKWIEEWTDAYPDEGLTWVVRGSLSFDAAGKARGSAQAIDTSDQQWDEMHDLTSIAHQQLDRAIALDPSDPIPWSRLLWVAIATSEPAELRQTLYGEGRRRSGPWFDLDRVMLTSLTKKWGGSHEKMFAFARRTAGDAKAGTMFPALIIEAHYERMLYALHWDHTIQAASEYFREPSLKPEINGVAQKIEGAGGTDAIYVANLLSYAFWAMGDMQNAHLWLQRTNAIQSHPWTEKLRSLATRKVNEALS